MVYLGHGQNQHSQPPACTGGRQLGTYGGLKNCSSETYMPRNISMSRKYLPALSSADSPSSHFFWRGNRKPGGGGPAGVAARGSVVLKKATVAGEAKRGANCECLRSVVADGPRASMVNGLVLAMVSACKGCGRRGEMSSWQTNVRFASFQQRQNVKQCNNGAMIGRVRRRRCDDGERRIWGCSVLWQETKHW